MSYFAMAEISSAEALERGDDYLKDLISRQAVIDLLKQMRKDGNMVPWEGKNVFARIRKLPSAQPDIIACGDCKHWICHDKRCGYWNHGVKPLEWCCHAERRTDE